MNIINIKYILYLDGKEPIRQFWNWKTFICFNTYTFNNDNKWATSSDVYEDSKLINITDWKIEKHWEEQDELGRKVQKYKTIQDFLRYGGEGKKIEFLK